MNTHTDKTGTGNKTPWNKGRQVGPKAPLKVVEDVGPSIRPVVVDLPFDPLSLQQLEKALSHCVRR